MSARWIPWSIASLFIPVFAVNGLLVHYALSSNTGLVTERAFDTGQSYNAVIAEGKRQDSLGWKAEAAIEPLPGPGHRASIVVAVTEAASEPVVGLKLAGRLFSPVDPQPDQPLVLAEEVPGHYRQTVALPRGGQWALQLMANGYAVEQRLTLP